MQILCPTDFSKAATNAADVAAGLARKLKLPLRLVHCAQDYVVVGELPVVVPNDEPLREQLKKEAERLRATDIEVVEELRHGSACFEIVAAASEQPTQMIVLGSVGKGLAERWLIGSVAERVAESAAVPTLVVRQPERLLAWLGGESTLRLLYGAELAAQADTVATAMQTLVALGRVEVDAAHVRGVEDPALSAEQRSDLQRDVWERLHAILGEAPVNVLVRDVMGLPATEFLHAADQQRSGLIVVGTHQRHGWRRLTGPSFSRNVLTHALTNVFCVPAIAATTNLQIPTIRRVLLATDFSPACTEALRHGHSLLPSGGSLHLLHVCHQPASGVDPVAATEVYFDHGIDTAAAKKDAEEKLVSLPSALLAVPGTLTTSEVIVHHDIAAAICDAAVRFEADVICMGTKGHSRAGVALLGSTVQAVLARSHKPVFVVTPPLA